MTQFKKADASFSLGAQQNLPEQVVRGQGVPIPIWRSLVLKVQKEDKEVYKLLVKKHTGAATHREQLVEQALASAEEVCNLRDKHGVSVADII